VIVTEITTLYVTEHVGTLTKHITCTAGKGEEANIMAADKEPVPCEICGSTRHKTLIAEMGIRCTGLAGIDKPAVWVSPHPVVCMNCGTAKFVVPEAELRLLGGCPNCCN
jgi:hypothetical protein